MTAKRRWYFRIIYLAIFLVFSFPRACLADYGPTQSVKSARMAEQAAWQAYCGSNRCSHMRVIDVTVVGRFALVTWEDDNSGGQSLLTNNKTLWHRIGHGGGVMNTDDLEGYGVPQKIATQLIVHNGASAYAQRLPVFPADKMAGDAQTVKRLESAQWKCRGADSCVSIRGIALADSYALIDWTTAHSGGEALWHKVHGTWHRLTAGGGSMGARDLQRYGVPHDVVLELIRTRNL